MRSRNRVPWYVWALGFAIASAGFCSVSGCDDPDAPPPPVGSPPPSSLPIAEESTGDPDPCAWDGACTSLEFIDECDGWAVACGDGWRCVTLPDDFVCELPGSSSGGEESTDGA
jgi:hypothetical protein